MPAAEQDAASGEGGAGMSRKTYLRRDESARYCIRFGGMLDPSWGAALGAMTFTDVDYDANMGVTSLRGLVADQAALLGILNFAVDLGMVLLLVELETDLQGA